MSVHAPPASSRMERPLAGLLQLGWLLMPVAAASLFTWQHAKGVELKQLSMVVARHDSGGTTLGGIALSSDGKFAAALSHEESGQVVRIWEPGSRKEVAVWEEYGESGSRPSFRFAPGGRWLFNDAAEVFDVIKRQKLARPEELIVSYLSLSPSGHALAIGLEGEGDVKEKRLRLVEFPTLKQQRAALDTFGSVKGMRHSPDGKYLLLILSDKGNDGGDESRLLLLDAVGGATLATVARWDSDNAPPEHFAFSADSRMIAAEHSRYLTAPGRLSWWAISTGKAKELGSVELDTGSMGLAFIDGGRAVAVQMEDGEAAVYDVSTGKLRGKSSLGSATEAECSLICPRRSLLISARSNGEVLVWDLAQSRLLARKEAHRGTVLGVAVSLDERFLGTVGKDDKATIWSLSE